MSDQGSGGRSRTMKIIGCDFHPSYQQIVMWDKATGEMLERALSHERKEEVRAFEVWIGDAAKIRASCERKQKTDRRDAELLVKLLDEERFPRIWVPTPAERDARQLLLHRHKLVRMRTQLKNQLQALALNQGVQRKWKLWSETGRKQLEALPLMPWGEPEEDGVAGAVGSTGSLDRRAGRCGHRTGQHTSSGAALDDAPGSGADYGAGVRLDNRTGTTLSPRQAGSQLSWSDSHGAFQWRPWAAAGTH